MLISTLFDIEGDFSTFLGVDFCVFMCGQTRDLILSRSGLENGFDP